MKFDDIKDELHSLADTGLKYAKNKADQAEIYVSSTQSMNVSNQSGMVNARVGLNEGVGVRVAIGKCLGFAAMSGLTTEAIKLTVDEAIAVAKSVKQENKDFDSFISPQKTSAKDGIVDDKIVATSSEDLVVTTNELYSEIKDYDKRIIGPSANVQTFYGGNAVANTEGISEASKSTAFVCVVSASAMEGEKRKSAFDYLVQRELPKEIAIAKKTAKKAVDLLASKPLGHTGVLPTLWNQNVMSNYWQMAFAHSVNGRQVVEKNSYFMDKLGDKVGIDGLTVADNGQLPEGINTSAIDAEGAHRQETTIIKNGVLQSFLYDSFYGKLGKAKSTGNANRNNAYESTPNIGLTTVVIEPGSKSFDDIVTDIDKGVLVLDSVMGMGHSNLISGDFSVVANSAYLIENGEISHPLDSVQIAGNLYKSFKNIIDIGTDSKLLANVKTPSILFDGFTLVG
jgi:PmbA protein